MATALRQKVEDFFKAYHHKVLQKGELVLFADDKVPPVSLLVRGTVSLYDISDAGNKTILTIYKPGAFFPLINAVNRTPNRYFFEALTSVELYQAPADEVVAFLKREPEVMFDFLQRLSRGLDGMLGRMSLLMAGTASSRVLFELSIAAERFGERQPDGRYKIELTETQLAEQTGLARETVSRELHKSERDGVIGLIKGGIIIDVAKLA